MPPKKAVKIRNDSKVKVLFMLLPPFKNERAVYTTLYKKLIPCLFFFKNYILGTVPGFTKKNYILGTVPGFTKNN